MQDRNHDGVPEAEGQTDLAGQLLGTAASEHVQTRFGDGIGGHARIRAVRSHAGNVDDAALALCQQGYGTLLSHHSYSVMSNHDGFECGQA